MSDPQALMQQLDEQFAHVWMVRTFIKHSEEAEEDDDLADVHRTLYDIMHALGRPLQEHDPEGYLAQVHKKLSKLKRAAELLAEIQPEISEHTTFRMANQSLTTAVGRISELMQEA